MVWKDTLPIPPPSLSALSSLKRIDGYLNRGFPRTDSSYDSSFGLVEGGQSGWRKHCRSIFVGVWWGGCGWMVLPGCSSAHRGRSFLGDPLDGPCADSYDNALAETINGLYGSMPKDAAPFSMCSMFGDPSR